MDILITIAFLALYLHPGAGNSDYFKDRIGRGCGARRCGLPDGCGISDTAVCGVFGLDSAKDSEVENMRKFNWDEFRMQIIRSQCIVRLRKKL